MFATNVLAHNDIFVNLHKGCGQAHNPITWRNAKLLNSQKMIISERAHPKDETEYDGMMLWAENMSHVVALYRHYAGRRLARFCPEGGRTLPAKVRCGRHI